MIRGWSLLLRDLVVVSKVCIAIGSGWSDVVGIVCGCIEAGGGIDRLFDGKEGDGDVFFGVSYNNFAIVVER